MKVTVELVYGPKSARSPRKLELTIKDGLKGGHLMNAIDRAVTKKAGDDLHWERWNLLDASSGSISG